MARAVAQWRAEVGFLHTHVYPSMMGGGSSLAAGHTSGVAGMMQAGGMQAGGMQAACMQGQPVAVA